MWHWAAYVPTPTALALAAFRACESIQARGNTVTICWVPAHCGIDGNEQADRLAKEAATRTTQDAGMETSLAHLSRKATEATSKATSAWIAGKIGRRRYRPPPGKGLKRKDLRHTRKELAGRYYQFLSGHAATGSYLCDKVRRLDSDECWFCGTGERMSRFHLVARCRAWVGQRRVLWKRVERLCEWGRPRAPAVRLLFDDVRATPAVLSFLRDTRVGKMVSLGPLCRDSRGSPGRVLWEDAVSEEEVEEDGQDPPG